MQASEIRQKYIDFFKNRNHVEIPAAPIVPPDDPTTLFTSSGMQQLVPYLKGEEHPMGTRLVDSQPSFRAEDIEEVGDNRHTTFFEMLGNWSLGDYFKNEQLPWFYEFLTEVLKLDKDNLYVTVFRGESGVPKDEESIAIWQKLFATDKSPRDGELGFDPQVKIYLYGGDKNWWSRSGAPDKMPVGEIGGPDSEVFYDFGPEHKFHENSPWASEPCHVNCDCGRFLEIGNSVFMQYIKTENGFQPLPKNNVDFGGGLERLTAAVQNQPDMFTTDLFHPIIKKLEARSGKKYEGLNLAPMRIIADHLRAAAFMIAQGVYPSNKMQGYILRRLMRRAALKAKQLGVASDIPASFKEIADIVFEIYKDLYFKDTDDKVVGTVVEEEISKFEKALNRGLKQFEKYETIDGRVAFDLLQTYGFPLELTIELAEGRGQKINRQEFEAEFNRHKELSRTAAAGMFKGGLADQSENVTKLHTATHLIHQALRQVLGDHVHQEGSNITAERLRFDFSHTKPLTEEEIQKVEAIVNQQIQANLPVAWEIMEKDKALAAGALAFFREKYPDRVKVYRIGDADHWFSMELCGGPHVDSTGVIGGVTIKKEEGLGAGKRRLYATLKN